MPFSQITLPRTLSPLSCHFNSLFYPLLIVAPLYHGMLLRHYALLYQFVGKITMQYATPLNHSILYATLLSTLPSPLATLLLFLSTSFCGINSSCHIPLLPYFATTLCMQNCHALCHTMHLCPILYPLATPLQPYIHSWYNFSPSLHFATLLTYATLPIRLSYHFVIRHYHATMPRYFVMPCNFLMSFNNATPLLCAISSEYLCGVTFLHHFATYHSFTTTLMPLKLDIVLW